MFTGTDIYLEERDRLNIRWKIRVSTSKLSGVYRNHPFYLSAHISRKHNSSKIDEPILHGETLLSYGI